MSIRAWEQMASELVDDPEMKGLTDGQVGAVVDVLALTIHADRKVTPVEVAGFNHLFFDLDWLEGRHDLVRELVPKSAAKASVDGDRDQGLALARAAAEVLGSDSLKERVFVMAASLAAVDMKMTPAENEALGWVAEAFGIDEEQRSKIIEQVRP